MGKRITKKQLSELRITKKQLSSSSSHSVMDLNSDMVTEILLNLPVKSLLRFRSVCKAWCTIIDSSAFRKSRGKNNNDIDDDYLFLRFSTMEDTTQWEVKSVDRRWKFPASFCRLLNFYAWNELVGVICMLDASPVEDEGGRLSAHVVLCNPVCCPAETKILPLSPILCKCLFAGIVLSRPCYLSRAVGFGFDSDYKVVQIIRSMDGVVYVEVYCARTDTWRLLDPFEYGGYERYFGGSNTAIKTGGSGAAAYWLFRGDDDEDDGVDEVIVSFDMHNEVFGIIRLPEEIEHVEFVAKDVDDSLVLVGYSRNFNISWNEVGFVSGSLMISLDICHDVKEEDWCNLE